MHTEKNNIVNFSTFGKLNQENKTTTRKSAKWLKKNGSIQERATGFGAALIKRKLYESDVDDDIDDDTNFTTPVSKKRRQKTRIEDEPLTLKCLWEKCDYVSDKYKEFTEHTFEHFSKNVKENEFVCKWNNCSYKSDSSKLFEIHFSYHPYYTKLKSIGANNVERLNLPPCLIEDEEAIPERSVPFQCDWEDCGVFFNRIQAYFYHVVCHVYGTPKIIQKGTKKHIVCCWLGCNSTAYSKSLLYLHVRSHISEKIIACPQCSRTFSCTTKFVDHRKRQDYNTAEQFQCSQCYKFFASERLLRNHVRLHVNHYKCHLCDMTCITPSTLSRHIRYRHLPYRYFKCELCEHSCVSKGDLNIHMMVHYPEKLFQCIDCNFQCRSAGGLERHYQKEHKSDLIDPRMYECHCCSKKFIRGATLTKHLISKHNFQWPSGHSRFRYKQDPEDGMYRLQTVRFESIEVTQEIIRGPSNQQTLLDDNLRINLDNKDQDENTDDSISSTLQKNIVPTNNNVLITICEVDESGNMVKTETVESNELRLADN